MSEFKDVPMVSYWLGRPISEMSRDELEREFTKLGQIYNNELENTARKSEHMADLYKRVAQS